MKSRALQSGSLDVSYEISASWDALEYAITSVTRINTTEFAASLTTELQQVDGLTSVTVDSMATPAAWTMAPTPKPTPWPTPEPTLLPWTTEEPTEEPAAETTEEPAEEHDDHDDHDDHDHDHETTPKPEPSTAEPSTAAPTKAATTATPTTDAPPVEDQSFTTLAAFGLALAVVGA